MPTVSQRIAKLTSEVNALREAASKFNVGDLVKPSTNYLRAIGPTTNKKDGIILGVIQNMRGYYIILWNDNDQPVAVAEGSLKMKKKNFKPNPHELRQKWKEYAFDPDSGGLMHKEDLAKKQKKASYVGTKVSHAREAAGRDLGWWQGDPGKWYVQEKAGWDREDLYFYPLKEQKNGGVKGLLKNDMRAGKAKLTSIDKMSKRMWHEVPESQVPDQVKTKIKARL